MRKKHRAVGLGNKSFHVRVAYACFCQCVELFGRRGGKTKDKTAKHCCVMFLYYFSLVNSVDHKKETKLMQNQMLGRASYKGNNAEERRSRAL